MTLFPLCSRRSPFFLLRRFTRRVEHPRHLLTWIGISTLIGIVVGVGAIAFYVAIHLASDLFLGTLVGYLPPDPAGEGSTHVMPLWAALRPWLLPVVTTLGGLLVGIFVCCLAPEAEGHGTDAAIKAFHEGTTIRARIPFIKLLASAMTIGTGGSAGPEGPVAHIGAGCGSILATLFHLDTHDRRVALAIGIGAGIGAIFRAPLGGAILAAEILYQDDLEAEVLIPALIASVVGYSIFGAWFGWHPIFATPGTLAFPSSPQLLYYGVIGILCGLLGRLYASGFYGITHLFHQISLPTWLKPALGGLIVGLIGLILPQALGMGDGWVQVSMEPGLLALPLWVLLLLPFGKILATGLSIGSGGSGGIFGPGMIIGGMTGALFWRLGYHWLPGLPTLPAPFVIVGMMALIGGVARVPIAGMLLVAEMTGAFSLLAPAMIAVSVSFLLVGKHTLYRSQLKTRGGAPTHRLQSLVPALAACTVRQVMTALQVRLDTEQTIAEAGTQKISGAPVLDGQGRLLGILTQTDIERSARRKGARQPVEEARLRKGLILHPDETLDKALEALTTHHVSWAAVGERKEMTGDQEVVGVVTVADIVRLSHTASRQDALHVRGEGEEISPDERNRRTEDPAEHAHSA